MNPVCTFHINGFCGLGKNCVNKHEKPSWELDVEAPSTTNQNVRKIPTNKRKIKETIDLTIDDDDNYHQLHTDIILLKNENTQLKGKLDTLKKSTMTLQKKLKEETDKNSKITEVLNEALLQDEEYQCPVCREVFIKPVLLTCGHMFCEWCLDKWLEKYNHCPTCRIIVINYTHCLNMSNFIERKMEQMPEKIRLAYKGIKESRAEEKQTSNAVGYP